MVPDGVEEVELARLELEQKERVRKIILEDIRKLSLLGDACGDAHPDTEDDLWMIVGGRAVLVSIEVSVVFSVTISDLMIVLHYVCEGFIFGGQSWFKVKMFLTHSCSCKVL